MEHEGSLQCSQEPATGLCPEPDASNSHLPTLFLISFHLRQGLPRDVFHSGFPTKILCLSLRCVLHVLTISSHHDLIILIILGEAYKLWSFSSCGLLQPPATSSLLGQNILISTLFSKTLIYVLLLGRETKFHIHIKQQVKLQLYFNL